MPVMLNVVPASEINVSTTPPPIVNDGSGVFQASGLRSTYRSLLGAGPSGLMGGLYRAAQRVGLERAVFQFRKQAALPPESQRVIDQGVLNVATQRMVLVNDLLNNTSLRRDLPNWLGVTELGYDAVNEVGHAQRTMIPKARGERQVMDRVRRLIPVYCTWDDFSFPIRDIMMAERIGLPLDTAHSENATRNVNAATEDQAWNGAGFAVHGNSAPGVLTSPVNSYPYAAWGGLTGEQIVGHIQAMIDMAVDDGYEGPFNFYYNPAYGSILNKDYKAASTDTIRQRILAIDAPGGTLTLRSAPKIGTNRTALIQMTSDVIDIVVGQTPQTITWSDGPEFEQFFIVLACMIVRIKVGYDSNKAGIVVGNV